MHNTTSLFAPVMSLRVVTTLFFSELTHIPTASLPYPAASLLHPAASCHILPYPAASRRILPYPRHVQPRPAAPPPHPRRTPAASPPHPATSRPTANCRPQTADSQPQPADSRPQTADSQPPTANRQPSTVDRRPSTTNNRDVRNPATGNPGHQKPGPTKKAAYQENVSNVAKTMEMTYRKHTIAHRTMIALPFQPLTYDNRDGGNLLRRIIRIA